MSRGQRRSQGVALLPPTLGKGGESRQVEKGSSVDEKAAAEGLVVYGQPGGSS